MNLAYEKATKRDLDVIFQYNKELLDQYMVHQELDYETLITVLRQKLEANIDEYIMVYWDEQQAGFYRFRNGNDGMMELDDLCVYSEFQNQKIGTTIIEKCCKETELPVYLYVFVENVRAWMLYERLGFFIVRNIENSVYMMVRNKQ